MMAVGVGGRYPNAMGVLFSVVVFSPFFDDGLIFSQTVEDFFIKQHVA